MKNQSRFSRRSLLRAGSLGPMASLLLPELRNPAYAQGAVPKNLVVIYTYHGTWSESWASGSGTGYQLGPLLAPLADFKSDMLLVKNLKMRSSELFPPTDNSSGHTQGAIHSTTSFKPMSDIYAGSPAIPGDESFDQAILRNLIARNGGKPLTEVESLSLAMLNSAFAPTGQMLGRIAYKRKPTGGVQILSPLQDPDAAWYKLFGTYNAGGGTTPGPMPGGMEDPARTKARLMATFAKGQYGSMANRVKDIYGVKTKERLDAHGEYMSALEKSLAPLNVPAGPGDPPVVVPSGSTCTVPPRSEFPMKPKTGWWDVTSTNMPRLAHLGLACGRTRFVGLQIEDSFSAGVHDRVHAGDKAGTTEYHLELARQVARLLKMLKDTPTSDGKNLLYHSAVCWIGELGNGQAHSQDGLHWMTAGHAGGNITPGRLIDAAGRSHADWFTAIGQAMDSGMTTFGEPRAFGGVMPGLKA